MIAAPHAEKDYATKADLANLRADLKADMAEIKHELKPLIRQVKILTWLVVGFYVWAALLLWIN